MGQTVAEEETHVANELDENEPAVEKYGDPTENSARREKRQE